MSEADNLKSRVEAAEIVRKNKQNIREPGFETESLFSENLY